MGKSQLDRVLEVYVKTICNTDRASPSEISRIAQSTKTAILGDLQDEQIKQAKKAINEEAKRFKEEALEEAGRFKENALAEAKSYRKTLFKKARRVLIYETILVALLVGIIVNQVTYLLPESTGWAWCLIIAAFLVCILLIQAEA